MHKWILAPLILLAGCDERAARDEIDRGTQRAEKALETADRKLDEMAHDVEREVEASVDEGVKDAKHAAKEVERRARQALERRDDGDDHD